MSFINELVCNKCYHPKRLGIRCFYFTQCGHIFCHQCTKTGVSMCQWCQTPDVQTIELSEPLPPSLVHLFTPRHEFLQNMTIIANFQFNQMVIRDKLSQQQSEKYNVLKRMYWEQRKVLLKIDHMKKKLTTSANELSAAQNYYQQATNSATSNDKYTQPENFFRQDNTVPNNFGHVKQNQRSGYPFSKKVAFVNPSNPYNTISSRDSYSPSTNMNTPRSMHTPITPDTVMYMANYRRVPRSAGESSAASSNTSSNILFKFS